MSWFLQSMRREANIGENVKQSNNHTRWPHGHLCNQNLAMKKWPIFPILYETVKLSSQLQNTLQLLWVSIDFQTNLGRLLLNVKGQEQQHLPCGCSVKFNHNFTSINKNVKKCKYTTLILVIQFHFNIISTFLMICFRFCNVADPSWSM